MINALHLYTAFLNSLHLEAFTLPYVYPFPHTSHTHLHNDADLMHQGHKGAFSIMSRDNSVFDQGGDCSTPEPLSHSHP